MSFRNWISRISGHMNEIEEPVPETINRKAWVQQPDGTWINARGHLWQKKDITRESSAHEEQVNVEVKPVKEPKSPAQKEFSEIKKKYDVLNNNFTEVSKQLDKELGIISTIEKELKTQKETNKELQSELEIVKQKTVELEMLILEFNREFGLIDIMSKMDGEIKNP